MSSSDSAERRAQATAWMESAERKEAAGDVDGAMHDFTAAMTVDATWPQPCLARGSLRYKAGRVDEAIDDFTRAIRLDPDYARAYAMRGAAYVAKREWGGAENDLTKALEAAPEHARLRALRIEARLGRDRGWAALEDANHLVEAHPDDAAGLFWRGLALEKVGDSAGAERDLREASARGHFDARDVLRKRYGGM
jgi:tetratricopeptide (TPR) repeat protein